MSHIVINTATDENMFYEGGTAGVEYFIVLSGFVMCAAYEKYAREGSLNWGRYMARRAIRIYPLNIFTLFLILPLIIPVRYTTDFMIICDFFLVQAWIPDAMVFYSCNIAAWCLSAFLFLYALFPFLIRIAVKDVKRFYWLTGIMMAALTIFIIWLPEERLGWGLARWLYRVFPPVRLADFMLGMSLWQIFSGLKDGHFHNGIVSLSYWKKTAIEVISLLLVAVGSILAYKLDQKWDTSLVWWIPITAVIMVYALFDKSGGLFSRIFNMKWLVYFGDASFCYYLLHVPIMYMFRKVYCHFPALQGIGWGWWAAAIFPTVIIASLIVYRYFDNPLGKRLRKLLNV